MMRTIVMLTAIGLIAFAGCKPPKPAKTIENLKTGITGETTASAKYAAFAQKAYEEGYDTIAKLFEAASKAEAIHAANHTKVLEELGEKMDSIHPEFEVKTTAENLEIARDGEAYEISRMYNQFITDAQEEKVVKAEKTFTWAMDTEEKHHEFYVNARIAILANAENTLPSGYAVCPVCGNTYAIATVDENCAFCGAPKENFINF